MVRMGKCTQCGIESPLVAKAIGVCGACIRSKPETKEPVKKKIFEPFLIPPIIDKQVTEKSKIPAMGFFDFHPCNCIGSWLCPGTTGSGYPLYAHSPQGDAGFKNLAVFFGGCSFDCLFCQDWIHKIMLEQQKPLFLIEEIVNWVDEMTSCVCFCGGTPDLYLRESILLSKKLREKKKGILRICAELNLTGKIEDLIEFSGLVIKSGGGLNIGLKAGNDAIHHAITDVSNKTVWENLRKLHQVFGRGETIPFLRPSLLIIPGYVGVREAKTVAERLADIDPDISLKLIGFLPRRYLRDLPPAADKDILMAAEAAREAGLKNVSPNADEIGNGKRFVRNKGRNNLCSI